MLCLPFILEHVDVQETFLITSITGKSNVKALFMRIFCSFAVVQRSSDIYLYATKH
jgi:hypothetical protein